MTKELQQILTDQFLNKRVEVKVLEKDKFGKDIPNKYVWLGGQCTFIGENEFLNIPLQINIDNHPVWVQHITDITLQPVKIFYEKAIEKFKRPDPET
jgi:hypothetical protein